MSYSGYHTASMGKTLCAETAVLLALFAFFAGSGIASAQDSVYMFSYFQESNGYNGLHLAYSFDGLSYHAVNGNNGIVQDIQTTPFMRDPFISYGPDGVFRMTYTTGWGGAAMGSTTVIDDIGYCTSTDLLNWTTPTHKTLPIANGQERWAPQILYDSANSNYLVYWATRVGTGGILNMYYSTTTDFNTFSTPAILYSRSSSSLHTIDGDIVKEGSNYTMFIAGTAETQGGTSLYGPYSTNAQQMTSGYASEGPSAIKIGNNWIVYNDHYGSGVYGAMMSADGMATWSEYTGYVAFPSGTRHGNVFTVPYSVAQNLAANAPSKPSEDEFVGAAGTTNFHTASNWFAGAVPGANQTPVIQGGYVADMNSSPSSAFSGLKVGQTSVGTLHINNAAAVVVTSAWPNGLVLGERVTGNGTIVQSDSSSVTVNGYASIGARGTGVYRLQGGSLTINGDLNVGDILGGHGDLYQANGTITAPSLYVGSGWAGGFTTGNCVGGVHQSGGVFTVTGSGDSVVIGGRDNAYGIGVYELSGGNFSAGNNANIFIGKYGQGSFTQTGGTVAAGQWLSIGRYAGSIGSYSIGDGALNQTNASTRIIVGEQGTGTLTVGGGLVDSVGGLRIGMNSGGTVGSGEVHLDGGTILTPMVEDGGGNSVLHFNGGTLKARIATAAFMQNLDLSDVQAGGATIDTNGFNITIAQPLLAGSITGGLTKTGLGVLTLTSPPSYMGDTVIEAGSLQMNFTAAILHNISGAGDLIVAGSTQLTAASIRVGTLTIGGSAAAVPEPSMTALMAMGLLIAATLGWCWKKSSPQLPD